MILLFVLCGSFPLWADQACEQKMKASGMMFLPKDPVIICSDRPSLEIQQCILEILAKGKNKLRNQDLMDVVSYCKTDPRPVMRDCLIKGLPQSLNDPRAPTVRAITSSCLWRRQLVSPRVPVMRRQPPPKTPPAKAAPRNLSPRSSK